LNFLSSGASLVVIGRSVPPESLQNFKQGEKRARVVERHTTTREPTLHHAVRATTTTTTTNAVTRLVLPAASASVAAPSRDAFGRNSTRTDRSRSRCAHGVPNV